jgi:hexosaminidase
MSFKYFFVLVFSVTFGFSQTQLPLIPQPKLYKIDDGFFLLTSETVIQTDDLSFEAYYLQEGIKRKTGLDLKIAITTQAKSQINLNLVDPNTTVFNREQYSLSVTTEFLQIQSGAKNGLFYGIQTLLQLLPYESKPEFKIPMIEIADRPKFSWRGMHLDVCRHFFPKEFIKKYIDYLAHYKMNTFHWHLTDDQGWRIEIKKYPKLTQIGAWRNGSMIGHYTDQQFDEQRYGGFYTQDDIKEIVAYANQRHITVVPEIEMPGHSQAALAAYPKFSCTGGPFEVAKGWGVFEDVFCPKEETFTFLEDVLTEVMALFPSEYIHIGGDESPKIRWKSCPNCQKRIRENGLKDEHELQSYFIQRIEKFVNSKGRKIIGWDEILEGGLAPNAAVMSWRGTEGGIAAAKEKHFVVMTPGSHCYFDHYQGDPKNEPLAFGGYTTLEKVYSFNPIPNVLTFEESKYILGAQGNLWTEYIDSEKQVEYMIFPRLLALSEVVWGTSNPKNFSGFQDRVIREFSVLDKMGVNYSKAIFELTSNAAPLKTGKGVEFHLKSAQSDAGIRYTIDGSLPTSESNQYANPIQINQNTTVKAAFFEKGIQKSAVVHQDFFVSKSTGSSITLVHPPHENYALGGAFSLIDGMKGNPKKFGRDWLGFSGKNMEATIDLGTTEKVSQLKIGVLSNEGSWIYFPKKAEVFTSKDGKKYKCRGKIAASDIEKTKGNIVLKIKKTSARYIKVVVHNAGIISDGKPGSGSNAWLFVDEIEVE